MLGLGFGLELPKNPVVAGSGARARGGGVVLVRWCVESRKTYRMVLGMVHPQDCTNYDTYDFDALVDAIAMVLG